MVGSMPARRIIASVLREVPQSGLWKIVTSLVSLMGMDP
jgi:hypothetical protein